MKLLILGGTAFLGRTIAEMALAQKFEVTCVARGESGTVPDGATFVAADRDHPDALDPVLDTQWDAVVDLARQPGHVWQACEDLAPYTEHYIFVSSGNVYADHSHPGGNEVATLLPSLEGPAMTDPSEYGSAKVACEDAVAARIGLERSTIIRAGLIGGPGDPSGRGGYWPWRFANPAPEKNRVLAPYSPSLPQAILDVRDLADWITVLAEHKRSGIYDAFGEIQLLPEILRLAKLAAEESTGTETELVEMPPVWLTNNGVAEWSGPESLPLWLTDPAWFGFNARSSRRAESAGLVRRPLSDTLADSLEWEQQRPADLPRQAGLSDERHSELLQGIR